MTIGIPCTSEVIKLRVDFRPFRNLRLTNKGGKDHFKALDLKNGFLLGNDKSLIYELILALVSLWLLVNLIKKEKSQSKNIRLIFFIILLKYIF